MPQNMKGKVAMVTGASSGIGRATALMFAREGAKVVVSDVDVTGGEEIADIIRKVGGDSFFVKADVSQAEQVENVVKKTGEAYGRLDYACNNAAIPAPRVPLIECPEEEWNRAIDIDLKSVWLCIKYQIPQMIKQGRGAIVNISSDAGLKPNKGATPYTAAKHGAIGLTKLAVLEHAESGIRVNTVCPGPILTPTAEELCKRDPERKAWYIELVPMKRMGTPEELAEAVVWLCSDAASFITGHTLAVEGGVADL